MRIRLFYMDPDPDFSGEVMYLKQYRYLLYILTWISLSVGPPGAKQQAYVVKFSVPVYFVLIIRVGPKSENTLNGSDSGNNTDPNGSGSATLGRIDFYTIIMYKRVNYARSVHIKF
jgi:hypothetical protein